MPHSYGMVLAKEKNEEEAMRWLIRSVHLYPNELGMLAGNDLLNWSG